MQILIGGVDKVSLYVARTLQIQDEVNARTTASFELIDKAGSYHPSNGAVVEIYDNDANLIFGGLIDDVIETNPMGTSALFYSISCVDFQSITDRRILNESYTSQTSGAIVTDVRTNILAGEGITVGQIDTGATIELGVYPTIPISQVFDELAEASGYSWWIDKNKALYFVNRSTFSAPFDITTASAYRNVTYRKSKEQYRNKQYIRAGKEKTSTQTATFKGDGEIQTFTVAFKIAEVPTITLNAGAQTVGIRGLDTGKDWYWSKDEKEISQDASGTKLTSSDTLSVSYVGFFPILTVAESSSAITSRKDTEGGTGIYESVEEQPSINDSTTALTLAQGKLDRYARISGELTYQTETTGLYAGQIQNITLPIHDIDSDFLIDKVTISQYDDTGLLRYDVHAVDGQALGGWVNMFKALLKVGKVVSIRENEVLIKLKSASDTVTVAESLSYIAAAPESRVGFATVDFSEVG